MTTEDEKTNLKLVTLHNITIVRLRLNIGAGMHDKQQEYCVPVWAVIAQVLKYISIVRTADVWLKQ